MEKLNESIEVLRTIEKISSKKATGVIRPNANQDLISTIKLNNRLKVSVNNIIYNSYQEYLNNY